MVSFSTDKPTFIDCRATLPEAVVAASMIGVTNGTVTEDAIEEEVVSTFELTAYAAVPATRTPATEIAVVIPTFMMFSFVGRWPLFITVRAPSKGNGVDLSKIHPIPMWGGRSQALKEAQWGCEGSAC